MSVCLQVPRQTVKFNADAAQEALPCAFDLCQTLCYVALQVARQSVKLILGGRAIQLEGPDTPAWGQINTSCGAEQSSLGLDVYIHGKIAVASYPFNVHSAKFTD